MLRLVGGGGCWQTQTLREGRYQLGNRESPDERAVLELYVVSSDLKQNNKNETKRGEPVPPPQFFSPLRAPFCSLGGVPPFWGPAVSKPRLCCGLGLQQAT